jgi:chemotaxis protein CheZ
MTISSTQREDQTIEAPVFERLGLIIRSLHDALRELGAEHVLADAAVEFPSARERLLHIGQLTERAANTVLTKVEETGPIQDRLTENAERLTPNWNVGSNLAEVPDSLTLLVEDTKSYLAQAQEGCSTTLAALSDMMMAQDFQDLTGQLIKKVVMVLEHTEDDLLKLLIEAAPPGTVSRVKKEEIMAGPAAPGGVALEQVGVDNLLADLGF